MPKAVCCSLLLAVGCVAYCQTDSSKLTFEVASVKPNQGDRLESKTGPGQFLVFGWPLRALIREAFDRNLWDLSCPAWMETALYDVAAKVSEGTTREQRRVMLQNLLVERFKIQFHHEPREGTVYDLVVAKGGPKLHPATAEDKADLAVAPRITFTPEGFPVIPPGSRPYSFKSGRGGQISFVTNRHSMKELADELTSELQRPVYDNTGLEGTYSFLLHYEPIPKAGGIPAMQRAGIASPVAPSGPPARAGTAASADAPGTADLNVDVKPTLFQALQSQLGLRLETRKAPVDVLVIDRAEKVPIEN